MLNVSLSQSSGDTIESFNQGFQLLQSCINEDNLQGLKKVIETGQAWTSDHNGLGVTALMLACQRNKINFVRYLHEKGANLNATDADNWTPLHYAAKEGHDAIVSYLLKNGAEVDARDDGRWTPLIWACYKGRKSAVHVLLDHGADVNAVGTYGVSGLSWAAGRNYVDIVKDLIRFDGNVNGGDKYGTTPLIWAARKGNLEIVKALIAANADIDAVGMNAWTPLIVAALGNHRNVVKFLLDNNPDINAQDKDGFSALTKVCKEELYDIASDLITAGAAIDAVDKSGCSNLIHAAKAGCRSIVELLLKNHANVNIQDREHKTALYWAVERMHVSLIPTLMEANCNLDLQTKDGDTVLMKAIRIHSLEIVSLLVERGAKISVRDKNGDTCVHIAMRARAKDIMELLLQNPASCQLLYHANLVGETPYSIDRTSAKPVITQLFGCHVSSPEELENALGCQMYSSALADMLSDPTLNMPLTVGLFANWGSGKSFLLEKLKKELDCFSHELHNPVMAAWSPATILAALIVGVIPGVTAGVASLNYRIGLTVFIITSLFFLTVLCFIWFYTQQAVKVSSCCFKVSSRIRGFVNAMNLSVKVLLCHPGGRLSNNRFQTYPINFYFTEQTKVNNSLDKNNSLVQMLNSLYKCVEQDYGTFPTRLYRSFRPQSIDAHTHWKWRKLCFLPYYVTCILTIIAVVGCGTIIYVYTMSIITKWSATALKLLLCLSSAFLCLVCFLNVLSMGKVLKNLTTSHQCHLEKTIANVRGSHHSFLYALKSEVALMLQMVACLDSFSERQSRMVIAFDGLDTGEQEKVLEILDAVHILFGDNQAPFIILFAIDPQVVSEGMEANWKTSISDGIVDAKDYMKNIVNLPMFMKNHKRHHHTHHRHDVRAKFTSDTNTAKNKIPTKLKAVQTRSVGNTSSRRIDTEESMILNNEIANLNILLEGDDYFSELSPRSMRRMINIINITGRLLTAFNINFSWEDLSCWVNLTELWPYRLSWICIYSLVSQNQMGEDMALKRIFEKIRSFIPGPQVERKSQLDRCENKLGDFLEQHIDSLTLFNLYTFLPYTISLDPHLRKEIIDKYHPNNEFFMSSGNLENMSDSTPLPLENSPDSDKCSGEGPASSLDECSRVPSTVANKLRAVQLESLGCDEVVDLFLDLQGVFTESHFRNRIREHGISGNALLCCDLNGLKEVLGMKFGDWEIFRTVIGILRQTNKV